MPRIILHDEPDPENMERVSVDDLRMQMEIELRLYHKAFLAARKLGQYQSEEEIVAALTKAWDRYVILRPKPDYRPPFEGWIGG